MFGVSPHHEIISEFLVGLVDCFYKPVLTCSGVNPILINSQQTHGLELQFIQPTQLFSQHSMMIIFDIPELSTPGISGSAITQPKNC